VAAGGVCRLLLGLIVELLEAQCSMVQLRNPLIFAGNLQGAEVRRRWRHTMIEWGEHELQSITTSGLYCPWPVSDCLTLLKPDCLWLLSSVHMAHVVRVAVHC
jgi:hypothetical protein